MPHRRIAPAIFLALFLFCAGGYLGRITYEPKVITETIYQPIEIIKEVPLQTREFRSLGELKDWLAEDDTDTHTYIPTVYDCDDFALDLVHNALKDGFEIFAVPVCNHIFNCAFIGNEVYYIEPSTDKVWFYALRD